MVKYIVLALQRWSALRGLPRNSLMSSYVIFDYYSPLTNGHDHVVIYELEGKCQLKYVSLDLFSENERTKAKVLSLMEIHRVFQFLKDHLRGETALLRLWFRHDPVTLKLFARDADSNWEFSLYISDVKCIDELRPLRGDFIEMIEQILDSTEEKNGSLRQAKPGEGG